MFRDWPFDLNFISWPWVCDNYIKFSPFPSGKTIHPLCIINSFISPLAVLDESTTWVCLIPLCRFLKSRIIIEAQHHVNPLILGRRAGGGTHRVFYQPTLQVFLRWAWAGPRSHCQPKIQISKCSPTAGAAPFHKKRRRSRDRRGLREHVPAHKCGYTNNLRTKRDGPPRLQAPLYWALPHAGKITEKNPDQPSTTASVHMVCGPRGHKPNACWGEGLASWTWHEAPFCSSSLGLTPRLPCLLRQCFSTLTAQRNHRQARRIFN